jgi:hypothetical protein
MRVPFSHAMVSWGALLSVEGDDISISGVPNFDGEHTAKRPGATGTLGGVRSDVTQAQLVRAAGEGVVRHLLDAAEASVSGPETGECFR